jgi:hypothetical protein
VLSDALDTRGTFVCCPQGARGGLAPRPLVRPPRFQPPELSPTRTELGCRFLPTWVSPGTTGTLCSHSSGSQCRP